MLNYADIFIRVASDCPTKKAIVPISGRVQKSIPQIEYEMLTKKPYTFTQAELLFAVHAERQGISKSELKMRRAEMWKEFFGKSRACLRASMLPKKFGWGLHFELVAMESEVYRDFVNGKDGLTVLTAMRIKRA